MKVKKKNRQCSNCEFYDKPYCRRNPPAVSHIGTYWTTTNTDDWCGEWQQEGEQYDDSAERIGVKGMTIHRIERERVIQSEEGKLAERWLEDYYPGQYDEYHIIGLANILCPEAKPERSMNSREKHE